MHAIGTVGNHVLCLQGIEGVHERGKRFALKLQLKSSQGTSLRILTENIHDPLLNLCQLHINPPYLITLSSSSS